MLKREKERGKRTKNEMLFPSAGPLPLSSLQVASFLVKVLGSQRRERLHRSEMEGLCSALKHAKASVATLFFFIV